MEDEQQQKLKEIVISPSKLPLFSVANAIHMAYTSSIVRLANALNLGNFEPIDTFSYRVYVTNPLTNESCCIVQRGADEWEPTALPFEVLISFMTILQIKIFNATYAAGGPEGGATIYIQSGNEDVVSRIMNLFDDRPEFGIWDIACLGDEDGVQETEKEDEKEAEVSQAGTQG